METQTPTNVIPQPVVLALHVMKEAVERAVHEEVRLLEATVKLCMALRESGHKMTGREIAEQTKASPGYVSLVLRATNKALDKRRPNLMEEAAKLGYKQFTRKYANHVYKPRKSPHPLSMERLSVVDRIHKFKDEITKALANATPQEQDAAMFAVYDMAEAIRHVRQPMPKRDIPASAGKHRSATH